MEEPQQINYNSLNAAELKSMAKERGIIGYSSMTKAILVKKLEKLG